MIKKVMFLLVSVALTIIATFIQQISSSDSPYNAAISVENTIYNIKLPVYHEGSDDCLIEIVMPDTSFRGRVYYKNLRGKSEWRSTNLIRMNDNLVNILPKQKPNVKLLYYAELYSNGKTYYLANNASPIIIRFQESVPKYLQFPEVIIMFLSLIFACFTGILTISHVDSYKKYAKLTFYLFSAGALLNLIMHIIAFRSMFLQIMPYNDLSFYKNLIIFSIWWGIYSFNKKREFQYLTLAATIVTFVLYCLPQHVIFGWIGDLLYS
jgi:hypothetical protein